MRIACIRGGADGPVAALLDLCDDVVVALGLCGLRGLRAGLGEARSDGAAGAGADTSDDCEERLKNHSFLM